MPDPTYMPRVYHRQNADAEVLASGGQLICESGGQLAASYGFTFFLGVDSYLTEMMNNIFRSQTVKTEFSAAELGATSISASTIGVWYGVVALHDIMSTESKFLSIPEASKGAALEFMFYTCESQATWTIQFSKNSISAFAQTGSRLSSIVLSMSGGDSAYACLRMACFDNAKWSVLDHGRGKNAATLRPE